MRLTTFILSVALLQVSASTLAQKVTIEVNNSSLKSVFKELKSQTGYNFLYTERQLRKSQPVSVQVKNTELKEVLQEIFTDQPLTYTLENKTIVIREKPAATLLPVSKIHAVTEVQQTNIIGFVTDEKGKPMNGVSVHITSSQGQSQTIQTVDRGAFAAPGFFVSGSAQSFELTFSYVGYNTHRITIKPNHREDKINVQLTPEEQEIGEVIVTGMFKKPMETFTGASVTITRDELQMAGTRNLISSIRNIDPSFNILENNQFGSNPNLVPEIQIRGNSNIPNVDELQDDTRIGLNTPLIILDGFESDLQKLLDINENEVESITLLKDASATSIYGSRGANGVIVITTRSPQMGKLSVTYRVDMNIEAPDLSSYNLLGAREKLELESLVGYYDNINNTSLQKYYNYILNEVNSGVNTDWLSQPLRNGIGQRHNLRLEGGGAEFRYSASAQLNNVLGVMKESGKRNINGNITLSYIYNKVKFRNSLQVTQGNSTNSPYGSFNQYVRMNPYWRAYDEYGRPLKFVGDPGNLDYRGLWGQNLPTNPLYNALLNTFDKEERFDLTNNTSVEWNIMHELTFRGQFGLSKNVNQQDVFRPGDHTAFASYTSEDIFRKGDYRYVTSNGLRYDASLNLSYNKLFDQKHFVFGGFDYNIRQNSTYSYNILAEGFNNSNFDFFPAALQYAKDGKPSGNESLVRSVGLTANLSYSYANKYFTDFSIRMDGSSQFGENTRFAPFWSVGAGWNLHEESFFDISEIVNRLKIRGSTGITGSQNFNAYQAQSTHSYYLDDRYFNWMGAHLMGLGNQDLRWQQNHKSNVGIEAEMFNRYLSLTGDYYVEVSKDMVSSVMLPYSNGFESYIDNIGKMRNKGFELKATVFLVKNIERGFSWNITMAAIQNRNKVLETSQALKDAQETIRNKSDNPSALMFIEGYSSNTIWVVPSLGIDPSSGKELYMDINGRPTFVWNGRDVIGYGSTEPTYFGNFSTLLKYKAFTFNAYFGYRFGGQQYNSTLLERVETNDYRYNVDQRVYDSRWKTPGDEVGFKSLLVTTPTNKTSRFVQDENTITCQNITIRYDVESKNILQKLRLNALAISANMADVFHISTIKRERGTSYPFARFIGLNFNATF